MPITIEGLKEYLKLLFKNGTAEMLYFFVGLYLLITRAPEMMNVDIFRILILIGVYLTFIGISLRLSLNLFQYVLLYVGETIDKYKNKEWTLESTIKDQVSTMAGETTKQLSETYFKKADEGETYTKEEILKENLELLHKELENVEGMEDVQDAIEKDIEKINQGQDVVHGPENGQE